MSAAPYRFGAVVSRCNGDYTQGMLLAALQVLKPHDVEVVYVPGAFEIPLQVQRLAWTQRFDGILALGLVWKGKTAHADEILRAVTDSLMRISLANDVPVLHEVLLIQTEKEARARTLGNKLNRGREAAEAALTVAALRTPRPLRRKQK